MAGTNLVPSDGPSRRGRPELAWKLWAIACAEAGSRQSTSPPSQRTLSKTRSRFLLARHALIGGLDRVICVGCHSRGPKRSDRQPARQCPRRVVCGDAETTAVMAIDATPSYGRRGAAAGARPGSLDVDHRKRTAAPRIVGNSGEVVGDWRTGEGWYTASLWLASDRAGDRHGRSIASTQENSRRAQAVGSFVRAEVMDRGEDWGLGFFGLFLFPPLTRRPPSAHRRLRSACKHGGGGGGAGDLSIRPVQWRMGGSFLSRVVTAPPAGGARPPRRRAGPL